LQAQTRPYQHIEERQPGYQMPGMPAPAKSQWRDTPSWQPPETDLQAATPRMGGRSSIIPVGSESPYYRDRDNLIQSQLNEMQSRQLPPVQPYEQRPAFSASPQVTATPTQPGQWSDFKIGVPPGTKVIGMAQQDVYNLATKLRQYKAGPQGMVNAYPTGDGNYVLDSGDYVSQQVFDYLSRNGMINPQVKSAFDYVMQFGLPRQPEAKKSFMQEYNEKLLSEDAKIKRARLLYNKMSGVDPMVIRRTLIANGLTPAEANAFIGNPDIKTFRNK